MVRTIFDVSARRPTHSTQNLKVKRNMLWRKTQGKVDESLGRNFSKASLEKEERKRKRGGVVKFGKLYQCMYF